MHPLRLIIRRFDDWLSGVEGVKSFTDNPQVILRSEEHTSELQSPL
jgi:hypothetical protein